MAVLNCIRFGKKQGEQQNCWPIVTFKYFIYWLSISRLHIYSYKDVFKFFTKLISLYFFFPFSIAISNTAKRDKKGKKNNTGLNVPMHFII